MREISSGLLCVTLFLLVTFPWGNETRGQQNRRFCLSNLRQQATAFLMYAEDHGDRLPSKTAWMDATYPYLKGWIPFHCPQVPKGACGYAFNAALSEAKSPTKPEAVPLVYDSVNPVRNASDPFTSLPKPGRHDGKDNVAYADGHARAVRP